MNDDDDDKTCQTFLINSFENKSKIKGKEISLKELWKITLQKQLRPGLDQKENVRELEAEERNWKNIY